MEIAVNAVVKRGWVLDGGCGHTIPLHIPMDMKTLLQFQRWLRLWVVSPDGQGMAKHGQY